ncbi:MAG: exodeoxyribonuclease I [Methylococcaceae bacterium]|nr:exodeoxyribonuclease I [Methylococcaceae bacterium]
MNQPTLFWHDYETFGTDPQRDRPSQFAGVRTDLDFKLLDEPVCFFCKTPDDYFPQPEACVITGITPQQVDATGLCEAEFTKRIHAQLVKPNTCTLGYNSLRFDDEVTRNILYRNFYDPYAREWQNGNSRWDLIDVVRAARALRPEGINWPNNAEARPSFRLEDLTRANGIEHTGAHDALVDVYATIALAKLLKTAQPKLFEFLWQHRGKTQALDLLQLSSFTPVVHISGMYPAFKQCLAIVLPLCKHPTNANEIVVYDLSIDPDPLLTLSVAEIQQRLFTASTDLPEGVARIPIKTIHINKCPVIAPLSVIRPVDAERLEIDLVLCQVNSDKIKSVSGVIEKLTAVYSNRAYPESADDPDVAIYSGGFFNDADKHALTKITGLSPEQLAKTVFTFKDKRLPQMLFRYRARNFPESLNNDERQQWRTFCVNRLTGLQSGASIHLDDYLTQLETLRANDQVNVKLIDTLETYAVEKMQRLGYDFSDHTIKIG